MSSNRNKKFRFGIASLLLLTAVVALVFRLTHDPGTVAISFQELEFDSTKHPISHPQFMPASIKSLDNRHVRIRGYIYPQSVFREKGIRKFVLARDQNEPDAKDCDFVIVRLTEQAAIDFTTRPVMITGVFSVLSPPISGGSKSLYYEIAGDEAESWRGEP